MNDGDRIKLETFQIKDLPDGECQVRVELGWGDEDRFVGTSTGPSSADGSCLCAAKATIQALETAADGKVAFDLEGVKALEAFDTIVVIAFLICHSERQNLPFLGACLVKEEHISRYAALAVLSATNRLSSVFEEFSGLAADRSEGA